MTQIVTGCRANTHTHTSTDAPRGSCRRAVRRFCTFSPLRRHRPPSLGIRGSTAQELHLLSCSCRSSPLTRFRGFCGTIGVDPARADDGAGPWRSGSRLQIRCRHLRDAAPPEVRAIRSRMTRLRDSVNVASCNDRSLVTAYCISAECQPTCGFGVVFFFSPFFWTTFIPSRKFPPSHRLHQP